MTLTHETYETSTHQTPNICTPRRDSIERRWTNDKRAHLDCITFFPRLLVESVLRMDDTPNNVAVFCQKCQKCPHKSTQQTNWSTMVQVIVTVVDHAGGRMAPITLSRPAGRRQDYAKFRTQGGETDNNSAATLMLEKFLPNGEHIPTGRVYFPQTDPSTWTVRTLQTFKPMQRVLAGDYDGNLSFHAGRLDAIPPKPPLNRDDEPWRPVLIQVRPKNTPNAAPAILTAHPLNPAVGVVPRQRRIGVSSRTTGELLDENRNAWTSMLPQLQIVDIPERVCIPPGRPQEWVQSDNIQRQYEWLFVALEHFSFTDGRHD